MSALARKNGWCGFDGIGDRVDADSSATRPSGGWEYRCDGMPSYFGCGKTLVTTRRLARVGAKSSGWLVIYGSNDPGDPGDDGKGNDTDVVLTFCPACAVVVMEQEAKK